MLGLGGYGVELRSVVMSPLGGPLGPGVERGEQGRPTPLQLEQLGRRAQLLQMRSAVQGPKLWLMVAPCGESVVGGVGWVAALLIAEGPLAG